jgi:DNA-binding ferritin-like protein (Dps family)
LVEKEEEIHTIKDNVGDALNNGMLLSLAGEQSTQHALVVGDDLVKVPENLINEFVKKRFSDDWRRS